MVGNVPCPTCNRRLRKHARSKRQVVWKRQIHSIPIQRMRCPSCDVTFSLIPFFIKPWERFANHIREFMVRWLLMGLPLSQLPFKLSTPEVSILSIRTLRRWKASLWSRWKQWYFQQRTDLSIREDLGPGLLPLYRTGFNSEQERNWILSSFLGIKEKFPSIGHVLSVLNLRLPPHMRG